MVIMAFFGFFFKGFLDNFKVEKQKDDLSTLEWVLKNDYLIKQDEESVRKLLFEGILKTMNDISVTNCNKKEDDSKQSGVLKGFGFSFLKDDNYLLITDILKKSPASAEGLKAGDKITYINGLSLGHLDSSKLEDIFQNESKIFLKLENNNEFNLKRKTILLDSISKHHNIIKINYLTKRTALEVKQALKDFKNNSLILDLTNLETGNLYNLNDFLSLFLNEGSFLYKREDNSGSKRVFSHKEPIYLGKLEVLLGEDPSFYGAIVTKVLFENKRINYPFALDSEYLIEDKVYLEDNKCLVYQKYKVSFEK